MFKLFILPRQNNSNVTHTFYRLLGLYLTWNKKYNQFMYFLEWNVSFDYYHKDKF
jgi:hypothetical protein